MFSAGNNLGVWKQNPEPSYVALEAYMIRHTMETLSELLAIC